MSTINRDGSAGVLEAALQGVEDWGQCTSSEWPNVGMARKASRISTPALENVLANSRALVDFAGSQLE